MGNRKCFSLSFLPTVLLLINFTVLKTKEIRLLKAVHSEGKKKNIS
jgi:hypothetical protein